MNPSDDRFHGRQRVRLLLVQEETHQQEVDGYADSEHGKHCGLFAEPQPKEDMEAAGLQEIVDNV